MKEDFEGLKKEVALDTQEVNALLSLSRKSLIDYSILAQRDYAPNWHHEIIAKKLEEVERGKCKRLMIFMPPRHGKSELASIKFPAWYLGRNPEKEVVCCSHTAELAEEFGRRTRLTVENEIHSAVFPNCKLVKGSKKVSDWKVGVKGGFSSVGVRGSLTGRGANLLIIDDPVKDRADAESDTLRRQTWEWYTSTALTRVEKGGAVIVIMTRWHDDDLAGRILQVDGEKKHYWNAEKGKWEKIEPGKIGPRTGKWDVLRLPAVAVEKEEYREEGDPLWEDKYNLEALADIKHSVGLRDWGALFQQDPVLDEGAEFQADWFKYWKTIPDYVKYVTTVDLAISKRDTADDSVVMTVAIDVHDNIYVVEYKNWKASPSEVIDEIYKRHEKYKGSIGVESVGYQQSLLHYLQLEGRKRGQYLHVEAIKTRGNKEEKIRGLQPYYANSMVFHPPGGCDELEDQLKRFPNARHDDVIDALSMCLGMIRRPSARNISSKPAYQQIGLQYNPDGSPRLNS